MRPNLSRKPEFFTSGSRTPEHLLWLTLRKELLKSTMLYATGIRVLAKHEVNWKRLMQRLRDHKAKLHLEIAGMAMLMKATRNDKAATAILCGAGTAMAKVRNDDKNALLYAGLVDGRFVKPRDTRTEHQSWRTIELATMKLTESEFIRNKSGPFSARAIGLFEMPNFDDPNIAQANLDAAAALHLQIAEMAHAPVENADPQEANVDSHSAGTAPTQPKASL